MILSTHCYIEKDNKILMLHRNKKKNDIHEGNWLGLGGKMESGETPEECIIREVKEESGLTIRNPILKGVLTFPNFMDSGDWYMFLFKCTDFSGDLIDSPEGNLKWISKEEMFELNLLEGDKLFMKWMDQYSFFSSKMIYENNELKDYTLNIY